MSRARKPAAAQPDQRKSMERLLAEHEEHRKLVGKNFVHRGSGDSYQLLALAHTESGNELVAVYCLNACRASNSRALSPNSSTGSRKGWASSRRQNDGENQHDGRAAGRG